MKAKCKPTSDALKPWATPSVTWRQTTLTGSETQNTKQSFVCVLRSVTTRSAAMLPLSLLRTAQNHPMLVELKNGETYNGHLVTCDNWMNINLREVICTSRDGDRFWRMTECYIRGSNIKYLRIPDEVIDLVREDVKSSKREAKRAPPQRGRGRSAGLGTRPQNAAIAGRGRAQQKRN